GRASFKDSPTDSKLAQACQTLAKVHNAWRPASSQWGLCPAIKRRLACLRSWLEKVQTGWRLEPHDSISLALMPLAQNAWDLLTHATAQLGIQLSPWLGKPVSLQMCLCDIWHDHLLFEGERLAGLIDFGSVKLDHVAADLARMLGSLVQDDLELRRR